MFKMRADKSWLIANNEAPVPGNAIVLGVTLPAVSYQPDEFGASQVITARAKFLDENVGLFITSIIERQMAKFSYSHKPGIDIYKNMSIPIPTRNSKIDFNFMRRYIATLKAERVATLKAERVATLKAYLQAADLSDTILSEGELAALDALRQNRVYWKEIPVCGKDGAFYVSNTHSILKAQVVPGSGNIPYVGAGESNNSIQSYISIDPEFIEKGNSIMIGGKTLVITYQEEDYASNDSHNLALYYKDIKNPSRTIQLFLVSSLYCSLKPKYHWGDSISNKKIQSDTFLLPTNKDGDIDYDFINNLISAQIKLCIKDVLNAKDLEIATTENVIDTNTPYSDQNYFSIAAEPFEIYQWHEVGQDAVSEAETVLIGCYRNRKHLEWILKNNLYNIRFDDRKGSARDKEKCIENVSQLYLYDLKNPDKSTVFRITGSKEMSGEEMKSLDYPSKSPGKSYMTFHIERIDSEINPEINVVSILQKLPHHRNGAPVFIEPPKDSYAH